MAAVLLHGVMSGSAVPAGWEIVWETSQEEVKPVGQDKENAPGRVFTCIDGEMVSLQNLTDFTFEVEPDAEFSDVFKRTMEPLIITIYFKRTNNWRKLHGLPVRRRRR